MLPSPCFALGIVLSGWEAVIGLHNALYQDKKFQCCSQKNRELPFLWLFNKYFDRLQMRCHIVRCPALWSIWPESVLWPWQLLHIYTLPSGYLVLTWCLAFGCQTPLGRIVVVRYSLFIICSFVNKVLNGALWGIKILGSFYNIYFYSILIHFTYIILALICLCKWVLYTNVIYCKYEPTKSSEINGIIN